MSILHYQTNRIYSVIVLYTIHLYSRNDENNTDIMDSKGKVEVLDNFVRRYYLIVAIVFVTLKTEGLTM